jgi:hypothetical protein
MKTKASYLLLLFFALFLTNANASGPKEPIGVKPLVVCSGIPLYYYGAIYFAGARVLFNGNLYSAVMINSDQIPGASYAWLYLGVCN